jgi:hypothetical protein
MRYFSFRMMQRSFGLRPLSASARQALSGPFRFLASSWHNRFALKVLAKKTLSKNAPDSIID